MAPTVTKSQSNRALLTRGGTGDLHHGRVANKLIKLSEECCSTKAVKK